MSEINQGLIQHIYQKSEIGKEVLVKTINQNNNLTCQFDNGVWIIKDNGYKVILVDNVITDKKPITNQLILDHVISNYTLDEVLELVDSNISNDVKSFFTGLRLTTWYNEQLPAIGFTKIESNVLASSTPYNSQVSNFVSKLANKTFYISFFGLPYFIFNGIDDIYNQSDLTQDSKNLWLENADVEMLNSLSFYCNKTDSACFVTPLNNWYTISKTWAEKVLFNNKLTEDRRSQLNYALTKPNGEKRAEFFSLLLKLTDIKKPVSDIIKENLYIS